MAIVEDLLIVNEKSQSGYEEESCEDLWILGCFHYNAELDLYNTNQHPVSSKISDR